MHGKARTTLEGLPWETMEAIMYTLARLPFRLRPTTKLEDSDAKDGPLANCRCRVWASTDAFDCCRLSASSHISGVVDGRPSRCYQRQHPDRPSERPLPTAR